MIKGLYLLQPKLHIKGLFKYFLLMALSVITLAEYAYAASQDCVCRRSGALWEIHCKNSNLLNVATVLKEAANIRFDIPLELSTSPVSINMSQATLKQIMDALLEPYNFTAESGASDNSLYSKIQLLGLKGVDGDKSISKDTPLSGAENQTQTMSNSINSPESKPSESSDTEGDKESSFGPLKGLLPSNVNENDLVRNSPLTPISEADKIKLDQEMNSMIANQRQGNANNQSGTAPFAILPASEKGKMPPWGKVDPNNRPPVLMNNQPN
jgi:hypothetical protein